MAALATTALGGQSGATPTATTPPTCSAPATTGSALTLPPGCTKRSLAHALISATWRVAKSVCQRWPVSAFTDRFRAETIPLELAISTSTQR